MRASFFDVDTYPARASISSTFCPSASAHATRSSRSSARTGFRSVDIDEPAPSGRSATISFASRSRRRSSARFAVIPVLVDGASMPRPRDLPDSLKKLRAPASHRDFHRSFDATPSATQNGTLLPKLRLLRPHRRRPPKVTEYACRGKRNGRHYFYARGVEPDYGKAMEWYRKAADQGIANAQYMIGVIRRRLWRLKDIEKQRGGIRGLQIRGMSPRRNLKLLQIADTVDGDIARAPSGSSVQLAARSAEKAVTALAWLNAKYSTQLNGLPITVSKKVVR